MDVVILSDEHAVAEVAAGIVIDLVATTPDAATDHHRETSAHEPER